MLSLCAAKQCSICSATSMCQPCCTSMLPYTVHRVASDSEQLQQLTKENTALKCDAGYQAEIAQQRAGRLKLRAHRRMVNRATLDCVMAWRQRTKEEVVKQRAQRSLKRAAKRMVHRGLSDGVLSWKWNYQVALVQRHQQSEKEALEGVHARRMAGGEWELCVVVCVCPRACECVTVVH